MKLFHMRGETLRLARTSLVAELPSVCPIIFIKLYSIFDLPINIVGFGPMEYVSINETNKRRVVKYR